MKTKKIEQREIDERSVASLPTRPTAPVGYGGRGFTASELKAAFDALPLLVAERLNSLIDDLSAEKESSPLGLLLTGIFQGHTLADLIDDVTNGNLSAYLSLGEESLSSAIESIRYSLGEVDNKVSALGTLRVKHTDSLRIIPEHNTSHRLGKRTELAITVPFEPREDFFCTITFESGATPTSLSYSEVVSFSGDSVTGGAFVPEANTHYTLFMWYDGKMQCIVRGVVNG